MRLRNTGLVVIKKKSTDQMNDYLSLFNSYYNLSKELREMKARPAWQVIREERKKNRSLRSEVAELKKALESRGATLNRAMAAQVKTRERLMELEREREQWTGRTRTSDLDVTLAFEDWKRWAS